MHACITYVASLSGQAWVDGSGASAVGADRWGGKLLSRATVCWLHVGCAPEHSFIQACSQLAALRLYSEYRHTRRLLYLCSLEAVAVVTCCWHITHVPPAAQVVEKKHFHATLHHSC